MMMMMSYYIPGVPGHCQMAPAICVLILIQKSYILSESRVKSATIPPLQNFGILFNQILNKKMRSVLKKIKKKEVCIIYICTLLPRSQLAVAGISKIVGRIFVVVKSNCPTYIYALARLTVDDALTMVNAKASSFGVS